MSDELDASLAGSIEDHRKGGPLWNCGHRHSTRTDAVACLEAQERLKVEMADQATPTPDPPFPPMTAGAIATNAAILVSSTRAVTHGDKHTNFANTATLWNALLAAKVRHAYTAPITLTPLDVANMLELFKIARRYSGTHNLDDYIDGAGYAACAGEIAERDNASATRPC